MKKNSGSPVGHETAKRLLGGDIGDRDCSILSDLNAEHHAAGLDADPDVPATGVTTRSPDGVQEGNRN
ncbi:hypothetical protein ACLKA6_016414 [Drosophila palustris]